MTVRELIAALSEIPPDARVLVSSEVAFNAVEGVELGRFYVTGEGTQGGWYGPYESCSATDFSEGTFDGVELRAS